MVECLMEWALVTQKLVMPITGLHGPLMAGPGGGGGGGGGTRTRLKVGLGLGLGLGLRLGLEARAIFISRMQATLTRDRSFMAADHLWRDTPLKL